MKNSQEKISKQAKKFSLLEKLLKEQDPMVPMPATPMAPMAPAIDTTTLDVGSPGSAPVPGPATPQVGPDGQPVVIELDNIIDRLNVIRGGKSLKDPEVYTQLNNYYNSLQVEQKNGLYEYLNRISQIVTGTPVNATPTPAVPQPMPTADVTVAPPTPAPVAPIAPATPPPATPAPVPSPVPGM